MKQGRIISTELDPDKSFKEINMKDLFNSSQQGVNQGNTSDNINTPEIPKFFVPGLENTFLPVAVWNRITINRKRVIIKCPKVRPYIGTDYIPVTLPSRELKTHSRTPRELGLYCSLTPFPEEFLKKTLEFKGKSSPYLKPLPGDDWAWVNLDCFRKGKIEERLGAYIALRIVYCRNQIQIDITHLQPETDKKYEEAADLDILNRRTADRLDDIKSMLAKDNILRRRIGREMHPLSSINWNQQTHEVGQKQKSWVLPSKTRQPEY